MSQKIKTIDSIEVMADEILRLGAENDRLDIENKVLRKQLYDQLYFNGKIIQNICVVPASAPVDQINKECFSCKSYGECKGMVGGGACSSFVDKSVYAKIPKISTFGLFCSRVISLIIGGSK